MKKPKVTIVYQYFGTSRSKWSTRWYDFAKKFKNDGYEVTIITSNFIRSDLEKVSLLPKVIKVEGLKIIILPFGDGNNYGKISRLFRALFFSIISIVYNILIPSNVLVCSSGPITAAVSLIIPKKTKKILEIRDLWPHGAFEMDKIPNNKFTRSILYGLEKILYMNANKIITCSPAQKSFLLEKYPSLLHNKIYIVEHGIDERILNDFNKYREKINKPKYSYWVVCATLGYIHNPFKWLKLSELISQLDNSIKIVLVGSGPLYSELENYIKKTELNNIILTGQLEKKEMNKWLSNAEFCLFSTLNNKIQRTCAPNKIYDYLAFEVPVLMDLDMWLTEKYSDFIWNLDFDKLTTEKLIELRKRKKELSSEIFTYHKKNLNRKVLAQSFFDGI